jgi:hypothetical protein
MYDLLQPDMTDISNESNKPRCSSQTILSYAPIVGNDSSAIRRIKRLPDPGFRGDQGIRAFQVLADPDPTFMIRETSPRIMKVSPFQTPAPLRAARPTDGFAQPAGYGGATHASRIPASPPRGGFLICSLPSIFGRDAPRAIFTFTLMALT